MANNDRIYEAYIGELGKALQDSTKKRIDWIIENTPKCNMLIDAGCSQGIISLLSSQKAEKVVGIDIQKEAVEFANKLLENEYSYLQNNVTFNHIDFINYTSSELADCIIASEVLEHLDMPEYFLKNIKSNLKPNGKLIVTVPFGVNRHHDHKTTFYMSSLVELVSKYFQVSEIKYLGKWFGIIAYNNNLEDFKYNLQHIKDEEQAFLEIHNNLIDEILLLKAKNKEVEKSQNLQLLYNNQVEKNAKLTSQIQTLENWHNSLQNWYELSTNKNDKLNEKIIDLNKQNIILENNLKNYEQKNNDETLLLNQKISILENKLKDYTQNEIDMKSQIKTLLSNINSKNKIITDYYNETNNQIQILKETKLHIKRLEGKCNNLVKKNNELKRKLSKITDKWYGRFAIKVYKFAKKVKNKIFR